MYMIFNRVTVHFVTIHIAFLHFSCAPCHNLSYILMLFLFLNQFKYFFLALIAFYVGKSVDISIFITFYFPSLIVIHGKIYWPGGTLFC